MRLLGFRLGLLSFSGIFSIPGGGHCVGWRRRLLVMYQGAAPWSWFGEAGIKG